MKEQKLKNIDFNKVKVSDLKKATIKGAGPEVAVINVD